MTSPISVGSLPPAPSAPAEPRPKNIKDAAAQFEAMLIQQMLQSTREAETGDSGSNTMRDFADQNLSQLLAKNGGLGIGSMIARGLQEKGSPASKPGAPNTLTHATGATIEKKVSESAMQIRKISTMRQNGN